MITNDIGKIAIFDLTYPIPKGWYICNGKNGTVNLFNSINANNTGIDTMYIHIQYTGEPNGE